MARGIAKEITKAFLKFIPTIITNITSTIDSIRLTIKPFTEVFTSVGWKYTVFAVIPSGNVLL